MKEPTLIRAKRVERRLTLDELSLLAGGKPTVSQLSRTERGFYCLTERELESVCGVLGISIDEASASIRKVADQARAALNAAVVCSA